MGSGGRPRSNVKRLLVGGTALGTVIAVLVVAATMASLMPTPRGAMSWRNAIPIDQELRNLNRVSQWPREWVDSVCEPPLHQLRNYKRLPNATYTASCRSLVEYAGDNSYLMVARYPNEYLMQIDLSNEGYTFYSFASYYGKLFVVATVTEASVTDSHGLGVSPFLQPLEQFGFNVYRDPGPP
jgi:hypothetical protein